jgi:hypothetical protein
MYVAIYIGLDDEEITDEDIKYLCDNVGCHKICILQLGKAKSK